MPTAVGTSLATHEIIIRRGTSSAVSLSQRREKRHRSRFRWKRQRVRNSDATAAGPPRIRLEAAPEPSHSASSCRPRTPLGPSRSSLEASQCPLETMKLSITSGHTQKAVQKPFTRWLRSRSLSKSMAPQHVLRRWMMRLPPFNRAVASLLSIHCCCCCHLSRLVRFLFSSGCLLSSLSHRHVKTVCVSKTGGTEERSCSAALVASTAQSSV